MKREHNTFDNQFIQSNFKPKETDTILAQKVDSVLIQKFSTVLQIYHNNAFQNGYNPSLAFRVIALYLYTQVKNQFNLLEEVNRFMIHQLEKGSLPQIQKCMDMLMIKSLKLRISQKHIKLWQIKIIVALKKYYKESGLKKEKKKASIGLREMCKEQLKKEDVKHDQDNYSQILDILLQEQYCILNNRKAKGKLFEAIQNGNNIIRALQKADQLLVSKYQEKLMTAYWQIARLHFHLHYITYARKYCDITINISQRINDKKTFIAARAMMDAINNG